MSHFFSFKQIMILHALTLHIQTHILMARTIQCDISHLLYIDMELTWGLSHCKYDLCSLRRGGSESADVNVCNNVSIWGMVQGDLIIALLAPPPVTLSIATPRPGLRWLQISHIQNTDTGAVAAAWWRSYCNLEITVAFELGVLNSGIETVMKTIFREEASSPFTNAMRDLVVNDP